jgi:hypothetical protein
VEAIMNDKNCRVLSIGTEEGAMCLHYRLA